MSRRDSRAWRQRLRDFRRVDTVSSFWDNFFFSVRRSWTALWRSEGEGMSFRLAMLLMPSSSSESQSQSFMSRRPVSLFDDDDDDAACVPMILLSFDEPFVDEAFVEDVVEGREKREKPRVEGMLYYSLYYSTSLFRS